MRWPTRPSTRSPLPQQPKTDKSFRSEGAGRSAPPLVRRRGKLEEETRLPMVRKIIQWVPIDRTRWRNEVANGHEPHGVDVPHSVTHHGPTPPLLALPSTSILV